MGTCVVTVPGGPREGAGQAGSGGRGMLSSFCLLRSCKSCRSELFSPVGSNLARPPEGCCEIWAPGCPFRGRSGAFQGRCIPKSLAAPAAPSSGASVGWLSHLIMLKEPRGLVGPLVSGRHSLASGCFLHGWLTGAEQRYPQG